MVWVDIMERSSIMGSSIKVHSMVDNSTVGTRELIVVDEDTITTSAVEDATLIKVTEATTTSSSTVTPTLNLTRTPARSNFPHHQKSR